MMIQRILFVLFLLVLSAPASATPPAPPASGSEVGKPTASPQVRQFLKQLGDIVERAGQTFRHAYFIEGDRPDGSRDDVEGGWTPAQALIEMRALIGQIRALDAQRAAKAAEIVDGLDAVWQKIVADETACRATPKCMADRLTPPLCELIEERAQAVAMIKAERANPAGVVNLARLHEYGEMVQTSDWQIKTAKANFLKAVHKPFADSQCKAVAK